MAANSAADSTIGERIAEALQKVGNEGVITVEDSQTFGVDLEFTEGMQFDKGYISPYFITDPDRQEAVLEDPVHPHRQPEDHFGPGLASCAREGHADRQGRIWCCPRTSRAKLSRRWW